MKLPLADHQKTLVPIADDEFVVEEVAIEDGDQTLANDTLNPARNITIAVTTSTISAGTVTVTGINAVTGLIDSEVLDLAVATTLTGTIMFSSITSVVVADLADEDPGDTIIVGTGDVVQVTVGRTTLVSVVVGVGLSADVSIIDGVSGSTADVAILTSAVPQVYRFNASISEGIRVVIDAEDITVIWNQ